jgi:hypothetical protein
VFDPDPGALVAAGGGGVDGVAAGAWCVGVPFPTAESPPPHPTSPATTRDETSVAMHERLICIERTSDES